MMGLKATGAATGGDAAFTTREFLVCVLCPPSLRPSELNEGDAARLNSESTDALEGEAALLSIASGEEFVGAAAR